MGPQRYTAAQIDELIAARVAIKRLELEEEHAVELRQMQARVDELTGALDAWGIHDVTMHRITFATCAAPEFTHSMEPDHVAEARRAYLRKRWPLASARLTEALVEDIQRTLVLVGEPTAEPIHRAGQGDHVPSLDEPPHCIYCGVTGPDLYGPDPCPEHRPMNAHQWDGGICARCGRARVGTPPLEECPGGPPAGTPAALT